MMPVALIRLIDQRGIDPSENKFENQPELDRVRETIILHQLNLEEFLLICPASCIFLTVSIQ